MKISKIKAAFNDFCSRLDPLDALDTSQHFHPGLRFDPLLVSSFTIKFEIRKIFWFFVIKDLHKLANPHPFVVRLWLEITGSREAERDAQSDPNNLNRIMPAEGCSERLKNTLPAEGVF